MADTIRYIAISRKVVGKSVRDNPERCCGWLWVHSSSKKFKRMAREAIEVCLWVLKESNKSRFDGVSWNSVLIISHITFRDCSVHIFGDNLSRNSCIQEWALQVCGSLGSTRGPRTACALRARRDYTLIPLGIIFKHFYCNFQTSIEHRNVSVLISHFPIPHSQTLLPF